MTRIVQQLLATEGRIFMNNTANIFKNKKLFMPFITCGDPNLKVTEEMVYAMVDAGADGIILGIPFSDPTVEGDILQKSNMRAITGEDAVTSAKVFEMVAAIKNNVNVPLYIKTYANVVYSFGIEKFASRCKDVGVQGLILLEIPYEEKDEFEPFCKQYGVDYIMAVANTSNERIKPIVQEAEGFIYCMQANDGESMDKTIEKVKAIKDIPCIVGVPQFNKEQTSEIIKYADGVSVDNEIVTMLAEYNKDTSTHLAEYVKMIKMAMTV